MSTASKRILSIVVDERTRKDVLHISQEMTAINLTASPAEIIDDAFKSPNELKLKSFENLTSNKIIIIMMMIKWNRLGILGRGQES